MISVSETSTPHSHWGTQLKILHYFFVKGYWFSEWNATHSPFRRKDNCITVMTFWSFSQSFILVYYMMLPKNNFLFCPHIQKWFQEILFKENRKILLHKYVLIVIHGEHLWFESLFSLFVHTFCKAILNCLAAICTSLAVSVEISGIEIEQLLRPINRSWNLGTAVQLTHSVCISFLPFKGRQRKKKKHEVLFWILVPLWSVS